MEKTEVKTDNEIIEDFWVSQGGKPHLKEDLSFYESDCSMLMPVVKKIDRLQLFDSVEYRELSEVGIFAEIDTVYQYVLAFIKWYESNKHLE